MVIYKIHPRLCICLGELPEIYVIVNYDVFFSLTKLL